MLPDQHRVFNPYASEVPNIDSGFHCEHLADTKPGFLALRQAGQLMNIQPHAVAGAVRKETIQPKVAQEAPSRSVRLRAGNARAECLQGGFLRSQDGLVEAPGLAIRPAHKDRSRHVRGVSGDYSTKVEDYQLARLERLRGCPRVRPSASRPGGNDRLEGRALRPFPPHSVFQLVCQVGFADSRFNELADPFKGLARNLGSATDVFNLRRVLDRSEFF